MATRRTTPPLADPPPPAAEEPSDALALRSYRDASKLLEEEKESIDTAARSLCEQMGWEDESTYEHAYALVLATAMFHDRNQEVHDAWKSVGFLGNLLTLYGKIIRLMNGLWWTKSEGRSEKPVDNAIDAINYTVFFLRCWWDENERGTPR